MNHEQVKENIAFYMENYDITRYLLKTENISNEDKKYIGNKNERKCRFCGKAKGETTFKKVAHAIPELIGNKILISFEECDKCNEIFSKLENELANFISFERSATGIRGKKGIPTYKSNSGLKIQHDKEKKNRFIIHDFLDSGHMEEDLDNKTITIGGERNPYIPLAVYKCFVKMALSIMPKEYLFNFIETIIWIRENDELLDNQVVCKIYEQFVPGGKPFHEIEVYLAIRKENVENTTPYCVFCICFGNFCYQVYLPFALPDHNKKTNKISYRYVLFPNKYALALRENSIQISLKDFSSNESKAGEIMKITYSYDEKIDLPIDEIGDNDN